MKEAPRSSKNGNKCKNCSFLTFFKYRVGMQKKACFLLLATFYQLFKKQLLIGFVDIWVAFWFPYFISHNILNNTKKFVKCPLIPLLNFFFEMIIVVMFWIFLCCTIFSNRQFYFPSVGNFKTYSFRDFLT